MKTIVIQTRYDEKEDDVTLMEVPDNVLTPFVDREIEKWKFIIKTLYSELNMEGGFTEDYIYETFRKSGAEKKYYIPNLIQLLKDYKLYDGYHIDNSLVQNNTIGTVLYYVYQEHEDWRAPEYHYIGIDFEN